MDYRIFDPHAKLKPYVKSIWIVTGAEIDVQKVVSDGHSELVFHFGDPYCIRKEEHWQTQSPWLAAGQIDAPILLKPNGVSKVIGFKFAPTGLWQLFGWNMRLLTNDALCLQQLFGPDIKNLQIKIEGTLSDAARVALIEGFLLNRLKLAHRKPALDPVIDRILTHGNTTSIPALARDFKLSVRKLERMFNEQIGVPPKVYAGIIRFRKVYDLLQQASLNTAEVSYLSGYFDQSHLNKDFKRFSGEDARTYFAGTHSFAKFLISAAQVTGSS